MKHLVGKEIKWGKIHLLMYFKCNFYKVTTGNKTLSGTQVSQINSLTIPSVFPPP